MHRNLVSGNIERYQRTVTVHRYLHLRAFRSLHHTYHTVLGSLGTGYGLILYLDDPVTLYKSCLLGRAARNGIKHYRRIVRNIESNAYTLEVSCKFALRFCKFYRRKVY